LHATEDECAIGPIVLIDANLTNASLIASNEILHSNEEEEVDEIDE